MIIYFVPVGIDRCGPSVLGLWLRSWVILKMAIAPITLILVGTKSTIEGNVAFRLVQIILMYNYFCTAQEVMNSLFLFSFPFND